MLGFGFLARREENGKFSYEYFKVLFYNCVQTSLLSDKSSELRSIINSLESLQERGAAGIYLANDLTNIDQDYLEKLVSQSVQIQCTEGSFNVEDTRILVTPPRFKVVAAEDDVFNTNISDVTPTPVSSPELLEDTTPSLSSSVGLSSNLSMKIPPMDIKKLDGSNVCDEEWGTRQVLLPAEL